MKKSFESILEYFSILRRQEVNLDYPLNKGCMLKLSII